MAEVRYVNYYGKKVSYEWFLILSKADDAKVPFTLNSGHRTMDEQQALFNQNMYGPGNPRPGRPLTAVPSSTAPHIKVGQWDHALDVQNSQALVAWLRTQGIEMAWTVGGESWHIEMVNGRSSAWVLANFKPDPLEVLYGDERLRVDRLLKYRSNAAKRGKWIAKERAAALVHIAWIGNRIRKLRKLKKPNKRQSERLNVLRDVFHRREPSL